MLGGAKATSIVAVQDRVSNREIVLQVDGIVANVNKMGFFADVGPLSVFVSSHVSFTHAGRKRPCPVQVKNELCFG